MNSWNRLKFVSIVVAMMMALVACGDDEATPNGGENNLPAPNNVPVPEGSRLVHVGSCSGQISCAVDATFNTQSALRVQLLDGNQNPITGARIDFELEAGMAAGTTLDARGAASDNEGMAEVTLRAGATTGVAEVNVVVPGDNSVEPIKFIAAVNPKDAASYRVNFTHEGPAQLRNIDVLLFPSTVSCDDVRQDLASQRDDDPETVPMLTAESTAQGIVLVDGTLPVVVFPGLENGEAYTVSAQAYSRENGEVELAFGCEDENDPITNGASVEVTVDLGDHLPRLEGAYDVVHTIRVTEAVCGEDGMSGVLPEGVCTAIDLVGRLATDPASFLLGEGMGDTGIIGLIVDFLPDDGVLGNLKSAITSFISSDLANAAGRDLLNDFFVDWINTEAPTWVQNARNITADIYDTVSEFRVAGIIRINKEAVPAMQNGEIVGLLEADMDGTMPGEQIWEDVIVNWTGACPADAPASCRERTFSASDLGSTASVVRGDFTGAVVVLTDEENPGYGLIVDPHSLSLNYGVLVLGIIENVVLPSVFGDGVTSLEDAFDALLSAVLGGDDGCAGLGQFVSDAADFGPNVASIAENLCDQLLQSAGDGVREFLTDNLVLEGEDAFVMQTAEACRISQPEVYPTEWIGQPLPYVQNLGTPEMQCNWDIEIAAGSSTINTEAPFNAQRSGF